MAVDYNPYRADVIRDPHSFYARMRAEDPVCHVPEFDCFALARFEDIWNAARDALHFSAAEGTTSAQLLTRQMGPYPALGNLDPPRHTERRKAIAPLLGPGVVAKLEAPIREIARARLARLASGEPLDVVTDYAAHIATGSLCLAVGFPIEDAGLLRDWVNRIFSRASDQTGLSDDGVAAYRDLADYAQELIRAERLRPAARDGIVQRYAAARVDGGRTLRDDEVAAHLREFMIGGTETFQRVLAAAVHRLFEHPEQREAIAREPGLAKAAFLEALRFDTPGQFMGRTAARDVAIRGVAIRKGQVVLLLWPSGNRDAEEFENPDVFDIRRRAPRMLGFGAGIHDCVGRHLAVLEGRVALESLIAAAPDYAVDLAAARRTGSEFVQGFTSLPLSG